MANIATAYVQIVPSTKGMAQSLTSAMDGASTKAGATASNNLSSGFLSGAGKVASAAVKVTTAAVGAAAAGVSTLASSAISAYSEFEQLQGGIETLFGTGGKTFAQYAASFEGTAEEAKASYEKLESAQATMMDNASNAYKKAGLSANEYMDTAVSMSAAMINSLDGNTEKAADMVDLAITDMSDNVNKMGTSMESIQNAYVGFSRGNYTMLDNLSLGFAGTKEGMQELLDKAEELSGVEYDISSYSDIVSAIHVVQTEMGITGTTAKEASTTISGSLNQAKAAWSNLVTGIADSNADLDELVNNLIESLVGVEEHVDHNGQKVMETSGLIDNVIPVIETALSSIGTLIEELVPEALELIPTLIDDVLPDIVSAATSLAEGLVTSLTENMGTISDVFSELLSAVIDLLPELVVLAGEIVGTLGSAIIDNLDVLLDAASEILEYILVGISQNTGNLISAAVQIITSLSNFIAENIGLILDVALNIIEGITTGLGENLSLIMDSALQIILALADGLIEFLPQFVEYLPMILDEIIAFLNESGPDILDAATELFNNLVEALPDILISLVDGFSEILQSLCDFMSGEGSSEILESAIYLFANIAAAIPEILGAVVGALITLLGNIGETMVSYASNMKSNASELFGNIKDGLEDAAKDILSKVKDKVTEWANAIKGKVSDFVSIGQNLITGLWNGISDKATWLYNQISGMGTTVINKVKSLFGVQSPSKVFAEIGGYLAEGLGVGWDKEITSVKEDIGNDMNFEGNINVEKNMASNSSDLNNQQTMTLHEYIDLGDTRLKEIISKYTLTQMGNETRATKVSQGGVYSYV